MASIRERGTTYEHSDYRTEADAVREPCADRLRRWHHGGRRNPTTPCRGTRPAGAGGGLRQTRSSPIQEARGEAFHAGTASQYDAAVWRSHLETRKAGAWGA